MIRYLPGPERTENVGPIVEEEIPHGRVPGDLAGVLRRNRWLVLACVLIVVGATAYFTSKLTPVYQATASIRIDDVRSGAVSLNPFGMAAGGELATEVEMLRSRSLAEMVSESLGLRVKVTRPARVARAEILDDITVSGESARGVFTLERQDGGHFLLRDSTGAVLQRVDAGSHFFVAGMRARLLPTAGNYSEVEFEVRTHAAAVAELQRDLTIERRGRDARVVDVEFESTDPRLAHEVPNALATTFIADRQTVQQSQSRSTVDFLEEQIAGIGQQLAAAESALREFREDQRVISVAEQATSEVRRSAELEAQLTALRSESASLSQLLRNVRMEASVTRPGEPSPFRNLVGFPALMRNSTASGLLNSIVTSEDRRADLLMRRSFDDPEVGILTARVEQLERQLEDIAQTYLSGLDDQILALESTLRRAGSEMEAIPAREARFAQLQREANLLEEIYVQLQSRLKESQIAAAVVDPNVRLIDSAIEPLSPIRPKPMINLSLALLAGLMLGISAAFMREYADKSIHTRNDVLRATGVPVLGFVPRASGATVVGRGSYTRLRRIGAPANGSGNGTAIGRLESGSAKRPLVSALDPWTPFAEAYNRLETNVAFALNGTDAKLIVMTSPLPGDGKTTSAINFAITLSQRGQRVLLVDADLRKGVLNTVFGLKREPGLSDVLSFDSTLMDAVQTVPAGDGSELNILTAGTLPSNPAQLLRSDRMRTLLKHLREEFDVVVLDAPPLNLVTDAALLGVESDGVVVVARSGVTTGEALSFTMEQLNNVGAPVIGAILNDVDFKRDAQYDRTYHYYSHFDAYAKR